MADAVLLEGADMVVGDRLSSTYFTQNKRPFHNAGNVLVRGLVNRFFRGNIVDIMTGYRAFSRLFVKSFPVLSKGFEIETEMSIHALDKNLRLVNVPVDYRDRPAGSQSKLNTYSDGAGAGDHFPAGQGLQAHGLFQRGVPGADGPPPCCLSRYSLSIWTPDWWSASPP